MYLWLLGVALSCRVWFGGCESVPLFSHDWHTSVVLCTSVVCHCQAGSLQLPVGCTASAQSSLLGPLQYDNFTLGIDIGTTFLVHPAAIATGAGLLTGRGRAPVAQPH